MDVDASGGRNGEDVGRQDQPVGGGDEEVRAVSGEALARRRRAQALRLLDRQTELNRRGLHRTPGHPPAPSGRPIRSRVHRRYPVRARRQHLERRNRELRRAREDDDHRRPVRQRPRAGA